MQRFKNFDSTGVAPNGVLYAGDLNEFEDLVAALSDFTQTIGLSVLEIGETGLQLLHYGSLEARLTGAFRTDGIIRGLGGLYAGAFSTTQRDAIASGYRPYGLIILNTDVNLFQWNSGTDPSPSWIAIGGSPLSWGTLASRPTAASSNSATFYFATDVNGGTLYYSNGTAWGQAAPGVTQAPAAHASTHYQGGTDEITHRILSAQPVYETGISTQIRAGRVLAATDFTSLLGLTAPVALYNLTDNTDASGNTRNLTNKGTVTFGSGISGAATEAAIFGGNTAQALYISDAGGTDPFRIPYGSFACWFRVAKNGTLQTLISKASSTAWAYLLQINTSNSLQLLLTTVAGAAAQLTLTDSYGTIVTDARWHHVACTYDGNTAYLYLDGQQVASGVPTTTGPLISAASPFNIGAQYADTSVNATNPFFGRIDEAFITQDVLSLDQVRLLYSTKIAHGYTMIPNRIQLNVRRLRKGAALTGFSTVPLHQYSFTAGAITDSGSLNYPLAANGSPAGCPGPAGGQDNAYALASASLQYFTVKDDLLPSGSASRSMGCWFKTSSTGAMWAITYGATDGSNDFGIDMASGGIIRIHMGATTVSAAGTFNDGLWHFVVVTANGGTPTDGLYFKIYVDGKLVGQSTSSLVATTLGGSTNFRIGSTIAGGSYWNGQIDEVFITNYVMEADEVAKVYASGAYSLGVSPKAEGDHVEGVDTTNVYLICDTLDSADEVDLLVAA